jgi:hypothetical protein
VSAVDLVRGDVQALLCDAAKEVGWKDAVLATEEVPRGHVGPRLEVPMFESTGGTETMRTMAGMADLMAGVKAKLDRADRHIRELKEEISAFFSREPFQIERVEEPDGGVLYRVRVREEPPIQLSTILGDAIHSLRTSLDLLARQLVVKNGATPSRSTCFPIAETEGAFRQLLGTALAGASSRAIGGVRSIRAFRNGARNLWLVHHLDIVDKHRLLLTVGCAYRAVSIDFGEQFRESGPNWAKDTPEMRLDLKPADRLFPLRDGAELYRIMPAARIGGTAEGSPQFRFEIAFAGGEVTAGMEVGETILALRESVRDSADKLAPLLA